MHPLQPARGTHPFADALRDLLFQAISTAPNALPNITQNIVDNLINGMIINGHVEVDHIMSDNTLDYAANLLRANQGALPALLDGLPNLQWDTQTQTYNGVPQEFRSEDFNATRTYASNGQLNGAKALSNLVKFIRRLETH